jgi:hypothetical protein
VSSGFLPILTPARLALSRPSVVLALISSLSNSARPPNTVSIGLPAGVVVSAHGSAKDLDRQQRSAICFTMVNRSIGATVTHTTTKEGEFSKSQVWRALRPASTALLTVERLEPRCRRSRQRGKSGIRCFAEMFGLVRQSARCFCCWSKTCFVFSSTLRWH